MSFGNDYINNVAVGTSKELFVASNLISHGYQVFRNLSNSGVDLIAYKNDQLLKVEVKSVRSIRGNFIRVNDVDNDYDIIIFVIGKKALKLYVYPQDLMPELKSVEKLDQYVGCYRIV